MTHERSARAARAARAAGLSVAASALLVVVKVALGIATGSVAVLSEAVHSASDLVAAVVAVLAIRASAKPPDRQHPYGHARLENVAALLEGALVVGAGIFVAVTALQRVVTGGEIRHLDLALVVMAASALVSGSVGLRVRHVARETGSPALSGDAMHLLTDAGMSLGVVVGLALVRATGEARLDAAVAMAVATIVVATGVRLCLASVHVLVDSNLPEADIASVEAALLPFEAEGYSFHKLRGRRAGSLCHVDLHMVVPPETTVHEGHRLTGRVKRSITDALPHAEVLIHLEDHE